ncbi:macrophage erythroblast attacher isoform 1 [Kwoniella heveanensis CBS 569]|nr:macrophage erythroblast attacher isoform 1 [Kwoniella heveanensis CBS 569]
MPLPTSTSGTLILEEPLIRTPYELLRRSHRSAQRQVEKDFTAVSTGLQNLLKSLGTSDQTDEGRRALASKLDQIGERTKGLKRKLDDIQPNAEQPTPLRVRLNYLNALETEHIKASGRIADGKDKAKPSVAVLKDEAVKMELDGEEEVAVPLESDAERAIDKTLDRYIIDYLLRTGRMKTAKTLAEGQNIDGLVDVKLFAELAKIETALVEKHSCTEALAWCGENRGTLKKTKNNLEFVLRLQEFIELCRKRDITSAIAYSRKNLSPWADTHMNELQQGMTLLAFGEKTGVGLYRKLYDQSQWEYVRSQFRETFFNLYAQPSQSVLSLALSAGLSSLRLPSCVHVPQHASISASSSATNGGSQTASGASGAGTAPASTSTLSHMLDSRGTHTVPLLPAAPPLHNLESWISSSPSDHLTAPLGGEHVPPKEDLHEHPEAPVGNVDCPTCGEYMRVLAREVPMSHHVNSTIVCRISGEVMDSQNEPLAFPNGYVYSSKALKQMAEANFDVVTCPRTRDSCSFSRLRKVYIS